MTERVGCRLRIELGILLAGQEVGTCLADVWQFAVSQYAGFGVVGLQRFQQVPEGGFLLGCPGVGLVSVGCQSALVAHSQRVLVVVSGVGTGQVLGAGLVDMTVTGDVVVVAREPEAIAMVADELHHGVSPIATGGGAVHYDEIDAAHNYIQLVTPSAVPMADSMLIPI